MGIPRENDQAHARRALDEALESQNRPPKNIDENASFCRNPAEYDWKYVGKREMLVPINCNEVDLARGDDDVPRSHPKPGSIRWEKHSVWIVEGTLHKGESNILALRRFYIDERTWLILLGEGCDQIGQLVSCYMLHTGERADKGRWYPAGTTEPKSP